MALVYGRGAMPMRLPDPEIVALRLKAARWLRGRLNEDGKPMALPVAELAAHEELVANGVTANRLEEIEQLRARRLRPMDLEPIARALALPASFFSEPDVDELLAREQAAEPAVEGASFLVATMRDLADRIEGRLDVIERQLADQAADEIERELERAAERRDRHHGAADERGERGSGS